jgi:hypothetical protein
MITLFVVGGGGAVGNTPILMLGMFIDILRFQIKIKILMYKFKYKRKFYFFIIIKRIFSKTLVFN